MNTGAGPVEWKRWIYVEWNRKLAEYFLGARAPEDRDVPLERIAATPEELGRVAGVDGSCAPALLEAFIASVRRELRQGQGFCDYCLGRHWDEDEFPPFFAMLWFTCLVAYGYPEGDGSFSDRLARALGKSENFHAPGADAPCLPGLWESVARWTEARHRAGLDIRRLSLPLEVGRRTTIGFSHFLAFPNRFDRAKLAAILHEADLVGAEPPLQFLLDTLLRHRRTFSREFQDDLDDFAQEYRAAARDPRDNAFWRAIRQEAASPSVAAADDEPLYASLAFVVDDDGLVPVLLCSAEFQAQDPYSVEPFDDGRSGSRLVGPAQDREMPTLEAFASGKYLGDRDRRLLKSGVLPLRENNSGLFLPTSGEDMHGCRSALVKDAIISDFTGRFGGVVRASIVPGWREVHGCQIVQLEELPPWLAGATSFLPTTELPSITFVGGIPVSDGFLFAQSFLPRVRAPEVVALEVQLSDSSRAPCIRLAENGEWGLPDTVSKAGDYLVVATWAVKTATGTVPRTRGTTLRLRTHAITEDYKGLPSGEFFQESCSERGESAVYAPDEPQLTVATADHARSTDIVDFDVSVRFLGPGVGEMTLMPKSGFDWLVVGPKKDPEFVLFVGDTENPTPPRAARSPSSGDRRHWHKAWQAPESRRFCRVGGVDPVDWANAPTSVRESWLHYQHHTIAEPVEQCEQTSLDTISITPLRRESQDARVDVVVDAIAALGAERRGLAYNVLSDLFAQLLGHDDLSLIRQLIRAWTESGCIDELRHAVSGRTMFIPRHPRFLLVRRGPEVDATLTGLVTPITSRHLTAAALRLGLSVHELGACNAWQPTPFRFRGRCDQIEGLRKTMGFKPSVWLDWPKRNEIPDGLDPRSSLQTLFRTAPPDSFAHDARWDWSECSFVRGQSEVADGVQLSRRMNRNYLRIYVVSNNGVPVCWTYQRSWALLAAYEHRGTPPFLVDPVNGRLTSVGRSPVHLPLPIARLCILIGEGASGPTVSSGRSEYVYPFGRRLFSLIQQVVPAAWLTH